MNTSVDNYISAIDIHCPTKESKKNVHDPFVTVTSQCLHFQNSTNYKVLNYSE